MVFLDAFMLNKPEIFIGNCAAKFDEKTGELKDEATRGLIKQQLAAFAPSSRASRRRGETFATRLAIRIRRAGANSGGNSWLTNTRRARDLRLPAQGLL